MARNRKRAKERRARRPDGSPPERRGVATARLDRDAAPDPIEHASPDVELAEAQLALGRPELADEEPPDAEPEALGGPGVPGVIGATPHVEVGEADARAPVGDAALPARRQRPGARVVTFLQGSWRELQRVQWPDRRQVIQATSVVIGFVIVAGLYLGLADLVSTKLMNLILK